MNICELVVVTLKPIFLSNSHRAAGMLYEDEEFTVSCGRLEHRVTTFGYRVAEKDRPGRFDKKKRRLLIPREEFMVS